MSRLIVLDKANCFGSVHRAGTQCSNRSANGPKQMPQNEAFSTQDHLDLLHRRPVDRFNLYWGDAKRGPVMLQAPPATEKQAR